MVAMRYAFALLLACGTSTSMAISALECPCSCPVDAAVDAQVDALTDAPGPTEIDLDTEWNCTTVTAGSMTPPLKGADGVSEDPDHCWITPWEQGNVVTRACSVSGTPTTTTVASVSAPEDAVSDDIDADGALDIVIAAAQRVRIKFGGAALPIELTASGGHGNVMQVALRDMTADGNTDIIMGTVALTGQPAVVALCVNPGPADARLSIAWSCETVSPAGWVMSLVPIDGSRMIVSDRNSYKVPIGTPCFRGGPATATGVCWDLYGARLMERVQDGTWLARPISMPAGSCSPLSYTSPSCAKTPGDAMFVALGDLDGDATPDVVFGSSSSSQADSRIVIYPDLGANPAERIVLAPRPSVGHYQGSAVYDADGDGDRDIVVSTWIADEPDQLPLSEADDAKQSLYWYRNNGDGTFTSGKVSSAGAKYDNIAQIRDTRCIITSEQVEQLGVVKCCPPGVP